MDALYTIRKLGFRRWHERQLIEAHAWLVTSFLALILAMALFENHDQTAQLGQRLPMLFGAVFSCLGAWSAYRRYFMTLQRAELLGEGATCPKCGAYGKLDVDEVGENDAGDVTRISACCRKCARHWQITT